MLCVRMNEQWSTGAKKPPEGNAWVHVCVFHMSVHLCVYIHTPTYICTEASQCVYLGSTCMLVVLRLMVCE